MKFFKREGSGVKALRAAVEANQSDEAWADSFVEQAKAIEQALSAATDMLKVEPGDGKVAAYLQASLDLPRASALRRTHELVAPALVQRRIERTRSPLCDALAEYVEAVDVQIADALKHDDDLANAIGESAGESPAVTKLKSEKSSASAAINQLGQPVAVHGEGTWLGRAGGWIQQLLGE